MMRGRLPSDLGRLMGALPTWPLELMCGRMARNAAAARPGFSARMGEYAEHTFVLDPVDCPFVFLLTPGHDQPTLRVARKPDDVEAIARISAPLLVLLGMLDGTYDGDALFFSRDLSIVGDTEAVLALRNAIENAGFDPASVLGIPASLGGVVNRTASTTLDRLRRVLGAPEPSDPS
jgi:predicted lipid carrier protein YhbT